MIQVQVAEELIEKVDYLAEKSAVYGGDARKSRLTRLLAGSIWVR